MERKPAPHNPLSIDGTSLPYLAFVLVVLAAYLPTLLQLGSRAGLVEALPRLGLGVVYLLLGTIGFEWIGRRPQRLLHLLYFALQIPLASLSTFIWPETSGLWVLGLPLVSQAVILLPRRWMYFIASAVIGSFALVVGMLAAWQDALSSALAYASGVAFVIIFTQIYANERQARRQIELLAEQLESANQQLRQSALKVEELATTQERNRLAREIHDNLGHYLTVINVQLEAARAVFQRDPSAARTAIEKSQALTREGLAEVRRSIAALRASPMDGRPLTEGIERLLEELRLEGLIGELTILGQAREPSQQVAHTFYRATQEALTNVRRHARASKVSIELDYRQDHQLRMRIADNGIGADPAQLAESFGLLGLRERLQLLGGRLTIACAPQNGFKLEIEVAL